MRHDRLIDKLGGTGELARRLDVHAVTVWRWRQTGIPRKWWARVQSLADEANLPLGDEALQRGIPYKRPAPEQAA